MTNRQRHVSLVCITQKYKINNVSEKKEGDLGNK